MGIPKTAESSPPVAGKKAGMDGNAYSQDLQERMEHVLIKVARLFRSGRCASPVALRRWAVARGFVLMPEPLAKVPRRLIGPDVFLC